MLRSNLLRLTIVLSFWLRAHHAVLAIDQRVEDNNSSIVYQPAASWHSNLDSCSSCLIPGGGTSYHEAIHPGSAPDTDDKTSTTKSHSSTKPVPTHTTPPPVKLAQSSSAPNPSSSATEDHGEHGGEKSQDPSRRRSLSIFNARLDPDDLPDPNVTLSFNFTGTAIRMFAILPLGQAPIMSDGTLTPTNTNLTFVLDSISYPPVVNTSSQAQLSFGPSSEVFSKMDLDNVPHQLVVKVGQNSTFLFDYLVFDDGTSNNSSTGPQSSADQAAPSPTSDLKAKKHNIATFAGAVGGSVGVLALFSLGLAFSIIRRRRLAAQRDRLDSESLHTNASDDSPHMAGPAPFMPRFFPDTVIPQDPPTYITAVATDHNNSTLLSSLASRAYASPPSNRSYADVPPSTPPPPLEDAVSLLPPPPFPVALNAPRTPPSGLPVGQSTPEGGVNHPSLGLENLAVVGTARSNSAMAPELVPLLQPVDIGGMPIPMPMPMHRPLSRISTRSIQYDINGNPIDHDDSSDDL